VNEHADTTRPMTIARLAEAAGVGVETIRYYQRRGLIEEPERPAQGYRVYPEAAAQRVRFIKRSQELGFTLREVGHLLELGDGHCCETQELATEKLGEIEARIRDLERLRGTLQRLVAACASNPSPGACPLVEDLTLN
jgi:MerR family transcriptional regulator, mercuric resistance operon regulatory protein